QTRNPKPQTRNPKPQTLNLQPQTLIPKPETQSPKPGNRNPKPQTLPPKPYTQQQADETEIGKLEVGEGTLRPAHARNPHPHTRQQAEEPEIGSPRESEEKTLPIVLDHVRFHPPLVSGCRVWNGTFAATRWTTRVSLHPASGCNVTKFVPDT
ncbi:hypothetical protein T484DRAFT_3649567, partial [Baffinella frigidus]